MITTVVFDIGNVLMKFDYRSYIRELFGDRPDGLHACNAIWESGLWTELDRGVDTQQVLDQMIAMDPNYKEAILRAFENAGGTMHKYDYAIPWIQAVKRRGYQVLYLSNYSSFARQAKPEVLDFLPYMDGGVFSYKVRLIKPDPEIYRALCEQYALKPENCVFIDDMEDNVDAARELRFHTIRFVNHKQAEKQLELLLQ